MRADVSLGDVISQRADQPTPFSASHHTSRALPDGSESTKESWHHEPRHDAAVAGVVVLLCALSLAGCNLLNETSPTSTTTDTFAGTLAVKGSNIFSFTVSSAGSVSVTLSSFGTAGAAAGLGVGTPSGTTECTIATSTPTATASSSPQISVSLAAGTYCVEVFDVGNLAAASTFAIQVTHP
jgi:hypothetical protein